VKEAPVCYTEIGRYSAVDKIAGWMFQHSVDPADKIMYTTGRLTSEMVIKTVRMGIPVWSRARLHRLASNWRAGGADAGRPHARQTLHRTVRTGSPRLDQNLDYVEEESARHKRKGEAATKLWRLLAGGLARRMGGGADTPDCRPAPSSVASSRGYRRNAPG
jgi:FdhD protein